MKLKEEATAIPYYDNEYDDGLKILKEYDDKKTVDILKTKHKMQSVKLYMYCLGNIRFTPDQYYYISHGGAWSITIYKGKNEKIPKI